MELPCQHIISKRQKIKHEIFDETLCDQRWTRNYYFKSHTVFKTTETQEDNSNNTVDVTVQF